MPNAVADWGIFGKVYEYITLLKFKYLSLHKVNEKGNIMSLINALEQLGSNSTLRQLSAEELSVALNLSASDALQLQSVLIANPQQLADLIQAPKYHCIMQIPAEEESEEPEERENSIQANTVH